MFRKSHKLTSIQNDYPKVVIEVALKITILQLVFARQPENLSSETENVIFGQQQDQKT